MTRVLYVEHNDDNLYMLKTRLELLGDFQVIAAEDIEKGRNLTVTEHPDVILMDLEMPNADCWEEVRRLKNDAQTGHIPIIGMSAYAVPSEREEAIATGCDEFEAKPIEFEFLVATIRRIIANRNNSPLCWSGWRAAWQAHGEHRAFALLARHGHVTAHHARELAGDGEAETGAAEAPRGRGIGLAELLEQLCLLLRRHANAGIDHR